MRKKISVIGATGKLAIPVINRLLENGIAVTAIVRDIEKARQVLSPDVELLVADLKDIDSLNSALQGTETLYLNLSTHPSSNGFQAEIDGVKNLLSAALGTPLKHIIKISAIGALHPEFNLQGEKFQPNEIRIKSHQLIKKSGINYTILHPTWFVNALPWFVNDGNFIVYGKDEFPLYWTNTNDFADLIANAIDNKSSFNQEFPVQGKDALTFTEAGEKYIQLTNKTLNIKQIPINEDAGKFKALMEYYENFKEQLVAEKTWHILGEPQSGIDQFIREKL
jgi:uncharacterized protein YbjT (DUF2867 family)